MLYYLVHKNLLPANEKVDLATVTREFVRKLLSLQGQILLYQGTEVCLYNKGCKKNYVRLNNKPF